MVAIMWPPKVLAFLVLYSAYTSSVAVEDQPPRITQPPTMTRDMQTKSVIFFDVDASQAKKLHCSAYGSEPITFSWTKDGVKLNVDDEMYVSNNKTNIPRIVYSDSKSGTILISDMVESDAGYYQCIAKNPYGTSLSKIVRLEKTIKKTFDKAGEKRYSVYPGEQLMMTCNPPKNNPPGKLKWVLYDDYRDERNSVVLDDRRAIDSEGNLYFANVKDSDKSGNGTYLCELYISELGMYIEGAPSVIDVKPGPINQFPSELWYSSEERVTALKGEKISFQCIFSGNPTPQITWVRIGGQQLDPSRMEKKYQTLVIYNVQYHDNGTYECRGENSIVTRAQTKRFRLDVESKPRWQSKKTKLRKQEVGVEETATFTCKAEGRPEPDIQWYINGKPLGSLDKESRRRLSNNQLTFFNVSRNDAQVIQCNASNKHGSLWADVPLSILAYKPEIKAKFTEVKVAADKDALLPCEIDGKPTPKIFWNREGLTMEGPRYLMDPTGNLTIKKTKQEDSGRWTCFAENRYGKLNSSGILIVRRRTKILQPPSPSIRSIQQGNGTHLMCAAEADPKEKLTITWLHNGEVAGRTKILQPPSPSIRSIQQGNGTHLMCAAEADPKEKLTITWLHNGEVVDFAKNPNWELATDNGLVIKNASSKETGNYTCVASTDLDSVTASAQLNVYAPPDPPTDVTVSNCDDRKAQISWKPGFDNFLAIKEYRVELHHSFDDMWRLGTVVKGAQKTEASVTLSPFANYTFRVIAVNQKGPSLPSVVSVEGCDTKSARPDSHPKGVDTTDWSKPGVLIVKWKPMPKITHNGDGFKYIINIRKNGKTNRTTISEWRTNRKEFNFGTIFEPYEVYVESKNDVGVCEEFALVSTGYTGEAEPLVAPSDLELVPGRNVTATSAWIQWTAVDTSPEAMRGQFRGYMVRFWIEGEQDTTMKEILIKREPPPDPRTKRRKRAVKDMAELTDLPPYSSILLDMVALNKNYESNSSNEINITTPEGVPSAVSNVRVLTRGAHHFLVEWEKPLEPNGELLGYRIEYRAITGFIISDVQGGEVYDDPDRSRAFIGDLNPATEYRLFISARTKAGYGTADYIDAKTANSGPLLMPVVTIANKGEDYINVTWNVMSKDEKPAGSSHFVRYRKMGKLEWRVTDEEVLNNWVNISGLEPNTKYEIAVVAKTKNFEEASDLQQVTTFGDRLAPSVNEDVGIASSPWFILMMVAIAILIVFVIIVCFVKRSRGEKYNVQEREKLGGTDPEAPEKDFFNEYPKSSETDPLAAGSPDSFDNEQDRLPGGSETDSMAEYGDVDPSKFNEDGSFIGQYGNQKPEEKPNQPSAMSTFV